MIWNGTHWDAFYPKRCTTWGPKPSPRCESRGGQSLDRSPVRRQSMLPAVTVFINTSTYMSLMGHLVLCKKFGIIWASTKSLKIVSFHSKNTKTSSKLVTTLKKKNKLPFGRTTSTFKSWHVLQHLDLLDYWSTMMTMSPGDCNCCKWTSCRQAADISCCL